MFYKSTDNQVYVCKGTTLGWVSGGSGYWATSGNDIYNTNLGDVGIGTNTPAEKLDIQNGRLQIKGVTIDHLTGVSIGCPAGYFALKKWAAKTCGPFVDCGRTAGCTTLASWDVGTSSAPQCGYNRNLDCVWVAFTCTADSWSEAICIGN
ncbi:MAG: hypothetical protein Q8N62_06775 [Candidatus Omnitrophota bacterium]|nr:hypothetical protein [Candidatus Omnitrophota bacterium]